MRAPLAGLLAIVFPCFLTFAGDAASAPVNPAVTAMRAQLEKNIAIDMPGIPLARALELLGKRAGVEVRIQDHDRLAMQAEVRFSAESVRAVDVLDALTEASSLVYEISPRGVAIFRANDPLRRKSVFRAYNVMDLTTEVMDASDAASEESPERAGSGATLANIADMIRNRVRPDSWDVALGTSIEERGGLLCVMQTEEIHALIRRLLASFRQKQTRQVALSVRVLSARSVDIDRLRAETNARGLSAPVLDDAAIEAIDGLVHDGSAAQLFAGNSIVFNMQRGTLQNVKVAPFVNGAEVSGNAYDPVVRYVNTGTVVRARPMLSDDGQWITLTLDAVHSDVDNVDEVVFQRGGRVRDNSSNTSTITIKHSERKKGDDETKNDKEDITKEFEINKDEPNVGTLALTGPMQLQMVSRSYSRVAQDMLLRPGQTVAVSAPMHGPNGLQLGHEMLVLVRAQPLAEPDVKANEEVEKPEVIADSVKQALAKPVTLTFVETPFSKAIELWMQQTKVPLLIKLSIAEEARAISLSAKDMPAREVLENILAQAEAEIQSRNSLLQIERKGNREMRRVRVRVIDIRDMTTNFVDHPGEMLAMPREATNAGAGANAFAMASADFVTSNLGAADFAAILKERMFAPEFASPYTSMEESGGKLIVMNVPEVLDRIHDALQDMRRSGRAPIVMTARWAIVDTSDLDGAFGKNPTALLDPDQAAKALALIGRVGVRDLQASRILSFNGQRLSTFGGLTRGFIKDYDISGDLPTPVIDQITSGGMADLTPRIMEGTDPDAPGQVMIDTRLVMARADAKLKAWDMLAVPNAKPVTAYPAAFGKFEQPSIDYERIFTTVRIPNNGAALFRLPVPAWVEGEDAAARTSGKRTMIVLLHAVQQKI